MFRITLLLIFALLQVNADATIANALFESPVLVENREVDFTSEPQPYNSWYWNLAGLSSLDGTHVSNGGAQSGSQYAFIKSEGSIYQSISLSAGTYIASWWDKSDTGIDAVYLVTVNSSSPIISKIVNTGTSQSSATPSWSARNLVFTVSQTAVYDLRLVNTGNNSLYLDSFYIQALQCEPKASFSNSDFANLGDISVDHYSGGPYCEGDCTQNIDVSPWYFGDDAGVSNAGDGSKYMSVQGSNGENYAYVATPYSFFGLCMYLQTGPNDLSFKYNVQNLGATTDTPQTAHVSVLSTTSSQTILDRQIPATDSNNFRLWNGTFEVQKNGIYWVQFTGSEETPFVYNHFNMTTTAPTVIEGLIAPASALYGRRLIISGGYDGLMDTNQVWDFNLFEDAAWVDEAEMLPSMFTNRSHHTSNVYYDYLFTFGGESSDLEAQQLSINVAPADRMHESYQEAGPHARIGHSATIRNHELYIYGGYDLHHKKYSNHLWKATLLNGNVQWQLIDMEAPPGPRAGHTAILYQESLYIFGGQNKTGFFNDVWRFDFITGLWIRSWVWDNVSDHPAGRVGHVGTYWNDESYYIFGGYGADGFLNDMWSFNLQKGIWRKIFEGQEAGYNSWTTNVPAPRAYMAHTVIDGELVILGGQVSKAGVTEKFWSPQTRWVYIDTPEDFAGDAWTYNFKTHQWTFVKCMDAYAHGDSSLPASCKSNHRPVCLNDCSGNGVCLRDNQCQCRGEWSGDDCSINPCYDTPFAGYDIDLMDRILISESILNLAQRLVSLRNKLLYINEYIPDFEDFVTIVRSSPGILKQMNSTTTKEGVNFNFDLEYTLLPIVEEFNEVLVSTKNEHLFYTPELSQYYGSE